MSTAPHTPEPRPISPAAHSPAAHSPSAAAAAASAAAAAPGARRRRIITLACAALALSATAALIGGNQAAAASTPAQDPCRTATSPLIGAHVSISYSRPGNVVREYTQRGRSPIFISTADLRHTTIGPILGPAVTHRQQVRDMIGPALSAVNGDFFTSLGSTGVEVARGGTPVKGTSVYQPAIITDPHLMPVIGRVRLNIGLHSRSRTGRTLVVAAQSYNSNAPVLNGLSVFDGHWGPAGLLGSIRWRSQQTTSYTVTGTRVSSVVPGISTTPIPAGGFRVIAQGSGNSQLVAAGWHVGTSVARVVSAQSPSTSRVLSALGVGQATIANSTILGSSCGYDSPTPRTLFALLPGGHTAVLVAASGAGLTMREANALLHGLGATSAAILDGGGSTVMTVRGRGPVQLTVHPYKWEGDRPVPDGLAVFNR